MEWLWNKPRWRPPFEGESFEQAIRQTACEAWIDAHRVPSDGSLDLVATAALLGAQVDLEYDPRNLERGRATDVWQNPVVHARSNLSLHEQRLTIAHELGHVYLERILMGGRLDNSDEVFCEYFGHALLLPQSVIDAYPAVDTNVLIKLAETFEMSEEAVIRRCMYLRKLPPKVRVRFNGQEITSCLGCGSYEYVPCAEVYDENMILLDFSDTSLNVASFTPCDNSPSA